MPFGKVGCEHVDRSRRVRSIFRNLQNKLQIKVTNAMADDQDSDHFHDLPDFVTEVLARARSREPLVVAGRQDEVVGVSQIGV